MVKLRVILGEALKDFEALDNIEKASFVLGCELWTENFDALLALVKEYIIDLWEVRKVRGRNGRTECILCGDECDSVVHVLWECPVYKDKMEGFMVKLRAILGEAFKDFEALDNIEKASFVLDCEL